MPAYFFHLTSRRAFEYDAPRPELRLVVTTDRGAVPVPFVVDTAASVTLIPLPFADALRISGPRSTAARRDRPRTLGGRLEGVRGEVTVRLGAIPPFVLPCFYYVPPELPAAPAAGTAPGNRQALRPTGSVAEWVARYETGEDFEPSEPLCVLGRLGFLNRIDLLVRRTEFVVSAPERIDRPPAATPTLPVPAPTPRRR